MPFDIAFTLGRTQPPHKAHFKMLLDALLSLNEHGKLVHFIGSTNIPLKFAKGEKNILSFEERAAMLTEGLMAELKERYNNNPSSIPAKFADRIKKGDRVLQPADFECIALPDFSDPNRQFSPNEDTSSIARPFEGIRTAAMEQVITENMAKINADNSVQLNHGKVVLTDEFSKTLSQLIHDQAEFHIPVTEDVVKKITQYGQPYMGWAINLRNQLNKQIDNYRADTGIKKPTVAYQCCDKDEGTLQYILLVAAVIEFVEHQYDFKLVLTPIEMLDASKAVSATDIRDAYVEILMDPELTVETLEASIKDPKKLIEKYPILAHMHEHGRVVMLRAMQALKKIADDPGLSSVAADPSSSSSHTVTSVAPVGTGHAPSHQTVRNDSSIQRGKK